MSESRGQRKLGLLAVLALSGVFLFSSVPSARAAVAPTDYNKAFNGTLKAENWNKLLGYSATDSAVYVNNTPLGDFLNTTLPGMVLGPLGVGVGPVTSTPARLTVKADGTKNILDLLDSSGAAKFSFLNNGNLGIGITAPEVRLDLFNGGFKSLSGTISGLAGSGNVLVMADNTGGLYSTTTSAIITPIVTTSGGWTANGTTVYKTDTNGNVGIGTINPTAKLDVYSSTDALVNLVSAVNQSSGFGMYEGSSSDVGFKLFYDGLSSNNFLIQSRPFGTTTLVTRLTIKRDDGNVGIGTTTPALKLDVLGDAKVSGSLVLGNSTYDANKDINLSASSSQTTATRYGSFLQIDQLVASTKPVAASFNISKFLGTSGTHYATYGSANFAYNSNVATTSYLGGIIGYAYNQSTGYVANAYGLSGYIYNQAGGRINTAVAGQQNIYNQSTGTIDDAYLFAGQASNSNASGHIGNLYGLWLSFSNSGVVDNSYGIYLKNTIDVGTNRYAIYSLATSPSYFAGNIGIGATTTAAKLDLFTGGFRGFSGTVSGLGGSGNVLVMADNTGGLYSTTTSAIITPIVTTSGGWTANGTTVYKTDTNGNVGIGTTTPSEKLHVIGNASITGYLNFPKNNTGSKISTAGSYNQQILIDYDYNNLYGGYDGFIVRANGTTDRFNIQDNGTTLLVPNGGNVGIGTTTPTNKLQVVQTSANLYDSALRIDEIFSGENNRLYIGADSDGAYYRTDYVAGGNLSHRFYTYNTERMRIDNAGNVGIGTTAPGTGNALNVKGLTPTIATGYGNSTGNMGQLVLEASDSYTTQKGGRIAFSGKAGTNGGAFSGQSRQDSVFGTIEGFKANNLANNAGGGLIFRTNYNPDGQMYERMRITDSGNVGIGNTAPDTKLDVSGSFRNTGATTHTGLAGSGNVLVMSDNTGSLYTTTTASFLSGNSGWTVNGTTVYKTDTNGNVGIGTTNPLAKLQVEGASSPTIRLYQTGGSNWWEWKTDGSSSYITDTTNAVKNLYLTAGGGAEIRTSGDLVALKVVNTAPANSLYIKGTTGNIGIGTTAPGEKLEVLGNIAASLALKVSSSTANSFIAGNLGVGSLSNGASRFSVFGNTSIGTGYFSTAAPSNGLIVEGNVGIGTSTPAAALHVVGNVQVSGGLTLGGDLNMAGKTLTVNKITANTIDPLYRIRGVNYSTFASSIAGGVKEEYVGRLKSTDFSVVSVKPKVYEAVIDFSKESEGSDLWVWRQTVDFGPDNVEVFVMPLNSFANLYASIEGNRLIVRSDHPVDASLRLVGKRFDWLNWPTRAKDQTAVVGGLVIE